MSARWTSADFTRRNLAQQERQRARLPKETANRITANILRAVNSQPGCVAYRINNVGVWDEAKSVYRKGNTQKGIADVSGIIRGRAVWVEVKAGRDKLSTEQLIFRQEVERAGGLYFEARSTDEFLVWFTEILKTI